MNELIISEIKDDVFYITLNNPSSQNTLSLNIINNLNEIILDSAKNNEIKVIIIRSVGKIFSAGHNLKEISLHRQDGDKGLKFFTTFDFGSCYEGPGFPVKFPVDDEIEKIFFCFVLGMSM